MSRLPKVSIAVRTASARCSASPACPATATATSGPPRDSTASASTSGLRAVTTTRAPRSTRLCAIASPIPRLPPVTRAVRPSIVPTLRSSSSPGRSGVHGRGGRGTPFGGWPTAGVRDATGRTRCRAREPVPHSPSSVEPRDTSGCSGTSDGNTQNRVTRTTRDHQRWRSLPTSGTRQGLEREVASMPASRRTLRAAGLTPAAAAPARLRVGIVGAGRVGAVLGAALAAAGHDVVAAAGLSTASAGRTARLLPGVPLLRADEVVAAADLVVLAVPDDTLPGLIAGLAETGAWRRGQLAFHTSGAHGLAVLAPAQLAGVLPLALHPAMTFTGAPEDVERLAGSPFGMTSRPEHRAVAEALVLEMGGEPFYVAEEDRGLYHAALVTGANHLVTLVAEAADLLRAAGVDSPARVLGPLLTAALDNGLRRGDRGLTGPVSRGDVGTVRNHLDTLTERAPASVAAYVAMARRTTERALDAGRLKRHEGAPLLDLLYDAVPAAHPATPPDPAGSR